MESIYPFFVDCSEMDVKKAFSDYKKMFSSDPPGTGYGASRYDLAVTSIESEIAATEDELAELEKITAEVSARLAKRRRFVQKPENT